MGSIQDTNPKYTRLVLFDELRKARTFHQDGIVYEPRAESLCGTSFHVIVVPTSLARKLLACHPDWYYVYQSPFIRTNFIDYDGSSVHRDHHPMKAVLKKVQTGVDEENGETIWSNLVSWVVDTETYNEPLPPNKVGNNKNEQDYVLIVEGLKAIRDKQKAKIENLERELKKASGGVEEATGELVEQLKAVTAAKDKAEAAKASLINQVKSLEEEVKKLKSKKAK